MKGGGYRVAIEPHAWRQLSKAPVQLQESLLQAIEGLEDDPRPQGYKKLAGRSGAFRIKVGSWRIVYRVFEDELLVLILEVFARQAGYR
jgi:mRNA interferase RelE/StbE